MEISTNQQRIYFFAGYLRLAMITHLVNSIVDPPVNVYIANWKTSFFNRSINYFFGNVQ